MTHILLAGSDVRRRAVLHGELTQTLAVDTVFAEAGAVSDVLEHVPGSSMAIITGEIDGTPAESLMQMLAHRHPELPVLIMDSPVGDTGGHISAPRGGLRLRAA
jgi:hypothetical protein